MCGIVGIQSENGAVSHDLYAALLTMQHRGRESARIVTSSYGKHFVEGGVGEVAQAFFGKSLDLLKGTVGIGHVRYGTSGTSGEGENAILNIQPVKGIFRGLPFYLADNGNLVNAETLRVKTRTPEDASDTRVIVSLISQSRAETFETALRNTVKVLRGSFNLISLYEERLYVVKDSFGFHPLQLGVRGKDWIIASESCAFHLLGAKLVRDISPGEFIIIDKRGVKFGQWTHDTSLKLDIFEFIYFLRPDSIVYGAEAGDARRRMGYYLSHEHPLDADVVLPIPDSGNEAALGYWAGLRERGYDIEFDNGALLRPHTVGRTFTEPIKEKREEYLHLKFSPRPTQLAGKRVILVDDSLVRGNTLRVIVGLLKEAGVREISMVISSPPYRHKDVYGNDTHRMERELIAGQLHGDDRKVAQEIASMHEIKYLGYLSLENTVRAVIEANPHSILLNDDFYAGPFTEIYPAGIGDF